MAQTMTHDEILTFIEEAPRTGHLATVRADGRPHIATIWIAVDRERGDVVFTTGADTVKGRTLARTGYAALAVDDPTPPFSFATLEGPVTIETDLAEVRRWATILGGRYMGADRAEEYGARNGVEGEWLCRLSPVKVIGMRDIAD